MKVSGFGDFRWWEELGFLDFRLFGKSSVLWREACGALDCCFGTTGTQQMHEVWVCRCVGWFCEGLWKDVRGSSKL